MVVSVPLLVTVEKERLTQGERERAPIKRRRKMYFESKFLDLLTNLLKFEYL